METQMLSSLHERQLKTLEQGINDIEMCTKEYRLYIVFVYENEINRGGVTYMNTKCFTVKNKNYYYDKINNIYNYFTLQKISIEKLRVWYEMEDDSE
jgi:hypothetical protein